MDTLYESIRCWTSVPYSRLTILSHSYPDAERLGMNAYRIQLFALAKLIAIFRDVYSKQIHRLARLRNVNNRGYAFVFRLLPH